MENIKRDRDNKEILSDNSSLHTIEEYRSLRTKIQFSLPAGKCQCIGITSAEKGEGKSTTAINLAIAFAQLGKKAIVVDADMRMPSIKSKLKVAQEKGLSNYLVGECSLKEIVGSDKNKKIYYVTSGTIPPDPTWLLQSERMELLIEVLKKQADYVFIDFPPVTVVSDATLISRLIDGYLMIVSTGKSSTMNIKKMVDTLESANCRILGFVNNIV